jgi:hypothetical protein
MLIVQTNWMNIHHPLSSFLGAFNNFAFIEYIIYQSIQKEIMIYGEDVVSAGGSFHCKI